MKCWPLVHVVRQLAQPRRLPAVHRLVAFGVVAHQHLDEGRLEIGDVLGIAVAVFELELLLAALLGGGAGDQAVRARVAQDRGTELLVDQDARRLARRILGQRELQPVIDDLLAGGDPRRLLGGERRGETEQPLLERGAMVEKAGCRVADPTSM